MAKVKVELPDESVILFRSPRLEQWAKYVDHPDANLARRELLLSTSTLPTKHTESILDKFPAFAPYACESLELLSLGGVASIEDDAAMTSTSNFPTGETVVFGAPDGDTWDRLTSNLTYGAALDTLRAVVSGDPAHLQSIVERFPGSVGPMFRSVSAVVGSAVSVVVKKE